MERTTDKQGMNIQEIYRDLKSRSKKNIILDTDTFNEVDDQFALVYAMFSHDTVNLLSVNAAPFLNRKVETPVEGMEKSYEEIKRVMAYADPTCRIPVFKGSTAFLESKDTPVESEAADNIIKTVMGTDAFVYIVAIGAITNVASAIIKCPELVKKSAVIWLGGVGYDSPNFPEFNMKQDIPAVQVVFDSGIPLVMIPTFGVSSELITSVPELREYLSGKNPICSYLFDIVKGYSQDKYAWSKVLWDIANIGLFNVPNAYDIVFRSTPIVFEGCRYSFDDARPACLYVRRIRRDPVYADMFQKLTSVKEKS